MKIRLPKYDLHFDAIRFNKILPLQKYRKAFSNLGGKGGYQEIPWAGITEDVEIELILKNIEMNTFYSTCLIIYKTLTNPSFTKKTQEALNIEIEVETTTAPIIYKLFPKHISSIYKPKRGHIFMTGLLYPEQNWTAGE